MEFCKSDYLDYITKVTNLIMKINNEKKKKKNLEREREIGREIEKKKDDCSKLFLTINTYFSSYKESLNNLCLGNENELGN